MRSLVTAEAIVKQTSRTRERQTGLGVLLSLSFIPRICQYSEKAFAAGRRAVRSRIDVKNLTSPIAPERAGGRRMVEKSKMGVSRHLRESDINRGDKGCQLNILENARGRKQSLRRGLSPS